MNPTIIPFFATLLINLMRIAFGYEMSTAEAEAAVGAGITLVGIVASFISWKKKSMKKNPPI